MVSTPSYAFAHYFVTFPLSPDNKPPQQDYYTLQFLTTTGENGKHAAYGGYVRDVPIRHVSRPRPEADWRLADCIDEVTWAKKYGLDGFTVDILSTKDESSPTSNWMRTKRIIKAAEAVPGFSILLMPDMSGPSFGQQAPDAFAAALAELANSPAVLRDDTGRLVLSPFKPETKSPAWWTGVFTTLRNGHNIDVAFLPCFLSFTSTTAGSYALPETIGYSNWGDRDPNSTSNDYKLAALAHSKGRLWMQPVSVQDERPNQGNFFESCNSQQFRESWNQAIKGNAEWVQIPTWNDYSEGAILGPSVRHQFSWLSLGAYYLTQWKTGKDPVIVKDAVFLSHRSQAVAAHGSYLPPAGIKPKIQVIRANNPTPRDTVEVLTFLTAPATLTLTQGATKATYQVPAGFAVTTAALVLDSTPNAVVTRDGQVVADVALTDRNAYPKESSTARATHAVTGRPYVQDLTYVAATNAPDPDWFSTMPAPAPVPTPVPAPAPLPDPKPWAVPIPGDPAVLTAEIKDNQTRSGIASDGLVGQQSLDAWKQALDERDAMRQALVDVQQTAGQAIKP